MRDVAREAAVSLKTVSRVVNGESGVSPHLVVRVQRAVDALGYRPHVGASMLRRTDGRTHSIALLLEDIGNPYAARLQRAIEDAADVNGFVVFAASLDEQPERERELATVFANRRADGLVVMASGPDQSHFEREMRAGVRLVFVDREPRGIVADAVVTTNRAGTSEAVGVLLRNGHRRIGFIGDLRTIATAEQRFAGYCDALGRYGVPVDETLVRRDVHDTQAADGAVTELLALADPPTALFMGKNTLTIGAVRALARLGLSDTVALIGFDDFPLADLLQPAVTVVAQHPVQIGELAARLLFARINGEDSPPRTHVIPTTFIRRGSGEILPRDR